MMNLNKIETNRIKATLLIAIFMISMFAVNPVMAQDDYVLSTTGQGIAEVNNEHSVIGSQSVILLLPPNIDGDDTAQLIFDYGQPLSTLESVSFQGMLEASIGGNPYYSRPRIFLEIDTNGDGIYSYGDDEYGSGTDARIEQKRYTQWTALEHWYSDELDDDGGDYVAPGDGQTHVQVFGDREGLLDNWYIDPITEWDHIYLGDLKEEVYSEGVTWGDLTVLRIKIGIGGWTGPYEDTVIAFIDDVKINGVPYDLEIPSGTTLTVDDDREQYPDAFFQQIQSAIDFASAGDTIQVYPGTYNPVSTIVIDKDNLVLQGPQANVDPRPSEGSVRTAGSTSEAIIDGGPTELDVIIAIDADNVVINGLEVKSGTGDMINQINPHSGTTVKYCIIHDGRGDEGVQLKKCTGGILEYNYVFEIAHAGDGLNIADESSYGIIRYNEVTGIHGENAAIYIYGSEHMEIIGNLVRDSGIGGNDGIKVGAKGGIDAALRDVLIKDNIIHGITQDGISVYMSGVVVEGNEIYDCHSENGAIYVAHAVSDITIRYNNVHNNVLDPVTKWDGKAAGILIGTDVDASTVTIKFNNIYNNEPFSITNEAANMLDATQNWWETTDSGEIDDMTSENVDYSPWLSVSVTVDSDGDGFKDYEEAFLGTEPDDPNDSPGAPVEAIVVELVTDDTGTVDASAEADTTVYYEAHDDTTIVVAKYDGTPEDKSIFQGTGNYIDVHVDDSTNLDSIKITMIYDPDDVVGPESNLRMHYWTDPEWAPCSNSGVTIADHEVWAILDWTTTTPTLKYLEGSVFGPGTPDPTIVLSPATGFATTITGDYFSAGTPPVTIKWDSTTLTTIPVEVTLNGDGIFVAIITALNADTGTYTITATDGVLTASADFTVPNMKGDKGDEGDKGDTGATGSKGSTGSSGSKGATGAQGSKGETGSQGETGPAGSEGEAGPQGPAGVQGPAGIQGELGSAGAAGSQGEPGSQGLQGEPGQSATIPVATMGGVTTLAAVIGVIATFLTQKRIKS